MSDAKIYNPTDTSVGGIHASFLIRGDERAYNLPPKPEVPTALLKPAWTAAATGAAAIVAASLLAFAFGSSGSSVPREDRGETPRNPRRGTPRTPRNSS